MKRKLGTAQVIAPVSVWKDRDDEREQTSHAVISLGRRGKVKLTYIHVAIPARTEESHFVVLHG